MIEDARWYTGNVQRGLQLSRQIDFPTANMHPSILNKDIQDGVYACFVKYKDTIYQGALYFGPKYIEDKKIQTLEIHIFNFHRTIYRHHLAFQLKHYIRSPLPFSSLEEVKKQLSIDVQQVAAYFEENKAIDTTR